MLVLNNCTFLFCHFCTFLYWHLQDDFIKPNYLEELYHVSLKNNSEVVIGSYKQFNEEDTKYYIHIFDYREENYINKELIEKISLLERKGLEFQPTWEVYSIEGYLKM